MTINWSSELGAITGFVIVSIIVFFLMKNSKHKKYSEETIQRNKNISGSYFFSIYAAAFFGVSIVIDIIALFTHNCEFNISGKYLFPLFIASFAYWKAKPASKIIKSNEEQKL